MPTSLPPTYPERYFEMFIAEQQLVATAVGFSVRGYVPFASTFAAFFTRAYDFIRMAAISQANIRLVGSHAGVEIGSDGPSQMALEDLAMMRAVHGSTVLYPSDATSTAALVAAMADQSGVVYLRTTRGAYPVLYPSGEEFAVGGSKVLRSSPDDQVTLIGAGVTLHHCLAAADALQGRGGRGQGHRPVLDQAHRHAPPSTPRQKRPAASSSSRTIIPKAGLGSAVLDALALSPTGSRADRGPSGRDRHARIRLRRRTPRYLRARPRRHRRRRPRPPASRRGLAARGVSCGPLLGLHVRGGSGGQRRSTKES